MINKIQSKTKINMTEFIKRLERELSISKMQYEENKKIAREQLIYSIYDTMTIILDTIHQSRVPEGLYTTWINMIKDYWVLNKYDKKYVSNIEAKESENSNIKVKSIQVGDTTTTFTDTSSQIEINGTTYNTGTINFNEDILVEKYKKSLYRHRRFPKG